MIADTLAGGNDHRWRPGQCLVDFTKVAHAVPHTNNNRERLAPQVILNGLVVQSFP